MLNKINGNLDEINGNNYLILVATKKSKDRIKKCEDLWIKIRDLIWPVAKKLDDYDEKYINIKLSSDDKLPLNKRIEIPVMVIVVRTISYENNKYYPQIFLD